MLSIQQLAQIGDAVLVQLTLEDERCNWSFGGGNTLRPTRDGEKIDAVASRLRENADLWLAVEIEAEGSLASFNVCEGRPDGGGASILCVDLWPEGELMIDPGEERRLTVSEVKSLGAATAAFSRVMLTVVRVLDQLEATPEQTPAVEVEIEALEFSGRAYQALKAAGIATIGELLALGVPRFRERFPDDYVRADIIRSLATAGYSFEAELTPENILH